jgi:hypothetical protein
MKRKQYIILVIFLCCTSIVFSNTIYFDLSYVIKEPLHYTINDAKALLKQGNVKVSETLDESVNWQIIPVIQIDKQSFETLYEANKKERQAFTIASKINGNVHQIFISSLSSKGLSNGIYYFLQNKLGFKFYHPKETIIPDLSNHLLDIFTETITPRFDKIGFHIHAMHPLEITEALLNEEIPNGAEEIKTYIDWLCRNGQNYFEFNLLRSIKLKTWIPYMKPIVDYAHQRGIICGADMSFHMIQQRAFQLYKNFPASFKSKDKQILQNIEQLMQINWDVWNVEFATTEFTHKDQDKLHKQQKFLFDNLSKYHVKLTSRKHVVKDENLISNSKSMKTARTDMDSAYSLFVHTVMFYGLNDSSTPVYRNKDFSHLRNLLIESKDYRDTWYFPESAYWITFDNSVPMFLTPYLETRLQDILYCDSLGIDGHLTFTSGLEWNYWLIDWSIARWCWKSSDTSIKTTALAFLKEVIKDSSSIDFVQKAAALQTDFIKNKQLVKVLTAQTITDEIGGKLNLEFHPRPEYSYKYVMNKATKDELDFIQKKYIIVLDSFVHQYQALKSRYKIPTNNKLINELVLSLNITSMRAEHRLNTLSYLIAYRLNKINKANKSIDDYLKIASTIRANANSLVKLQENLSYRYSLTNVAAKKKSKTVYNFGYLYPVSNLHFWEREELQAKNNKWKFYYKNIWDVLKIIGVKK